MRSTALALGALLALAAPALASAADDDVKAAPSCKFCGMDREKFGFSRMLVEYEDGAKVGTCSIHCTAIEIVGAMDRAPKAFYVGDVQTKKLLDAEKAIWVVGGGKPGVMTRRGKWAFETQAAAEAFVKESGGAITTFEGALEAAYQDIYLDNKMVREKRKAMRAKMGDKPAEKAPAGHEGHGEHKH